MTLPPRDIEGACAALTARFGNRLDRSLGSRRTHTHTVTYLAAELDGDYRQKTIASTGGTAPASN